MSISDVKQRHFIIFHQQFCSSAKLEMIETRISQNFFTWFHPSWSSVSKPQIKRPGPNNPTPTLPLLSLCLWDRAQTGAETVPSAEFHRSKRVKWRKNICAKLSCWWYIGHGSCPANHFLTVKALGPSLAPPGGQNAEPKKSPWCRHWKVLKMTLSWWTEIKIERTTQLMAFLDDEKGKHARQYTFTRLDGGRSLEKAKKLAHWKQFDDFSRQLLVCKQSSNLLKLMPELLQDFLDAWTIWNQHIQRYACRWLK